MLKKISKKSLFAKEYLQIKEKTFAKKNHITRLQQANKKTISHLIKLKEVKENTNLAIN